MLLNMNYSSGASTDKNIFYSLALNDLLFCDSGSSHGCHRYINLICITGNRKRVTPCGSIVLKTSVLSLIHLHSDAVNILIVRKILCLYTIYKMNHKPAVSCDGMCFYSPLVSFYWWWIGYFKL